MAMPFSLFGRRVFFPPAHEKEAGSLFSGFQNKLEVVIMTLSQLQYNLHIDYTSVYQRFPAKHLI